MNQYDDGKDERPVLPMGEAPSLEPLAAFEDFKREQIRRICESIYGRPLFKFRDEIGC